MNLELQTMWSPDLDLPSEGKPQDVNNFSILLQLSIGEKGKPGGEVFSLTVCSPSMLEIESGMFIQNTLVIDTFSWVIIKKRIEKLLTHVQGSSSWKEVILKLAGLLHYSDEELWRL